MAKENAAIAVYDTHIQAEAAIKELQKSGIDMKKLVHCGQGLPCRRERGGLL